MFARNLLIVALFSPAAVAGAAGPLLAMTIVALIFVRRAYTGNDQAPTEIHLESPVSLKRVLSFAVLFLAIQIVSTLGERYLGKFGFLGVSILGGLVSSASTSAAAANMVGHGQMQANLAGAGVVLASVASAVINLPIIHRAAKNSALSKQLAFLTVVLSLVGIAILAIQQYLGFFRI
jgi:uncharacterized membrane protein (DUF4010 family)